jgi:hypothetical protein
MAATKYTYSISGDFPNAKVNSDSLTIEIQASAIVTALDRIDTAGDVCDIWFKDALSAGDETVLDAVVAAHQGVAPPWAPTNAVGAPIIEITGQQTDNQAIKVAQAGREGTEWTTASHNFCDPSTWFSTATSVTAEVMVDSGDGLTWTPTGAQKPWVDLTHGKVLWEDSFNTDYLVVVTVDAVEMTEDPMYGAAEDYTVDYIQGTVTFHASQAGKAVLATFSHVQNSHWVTKPATGKKLVIEDAEIQFSADLSYNDTLVLEPQGWVQVFAPELWDGYDPPGPYPANTLIPLTPRRRRYMRHDQILDEARGAYPTIGTVGGLGGHTTERFGYPFTYKTVTELHAAYGMELHVYLEKEITMGGERATVTFYGVEDDEG